MNAASVGCRLSRITAAVVIVCGMFSRAASAEIIHLKNGNRIEGKISKQDPHAVWVQLDRGEVVFSR